MAANTKAAVVHPNQSFRLALWASEGFTIAGISPITSAGNNFLISFVLYKRSSIISNTPTTNTPSARPAAKPDTAEL